MVKGAIAKIKTADMLTTLRASAAKAKVLAVDVSGDFLSSIAIAIDDNDFQTVTTMAKCEADSALLKSDIVVDILDDMIDKISAYLKVLEVCEDD